jgi:hypothetical protein
MGKRSTHIDAHRIAQEHLVLTEDQLRAMERAPAEKEAHGEIETAHPGYLGAQDTYYVGTIKGVGRIYQQTFLDTYTKVSSLRWTHASHRTAHRGPDPTPFSAPTLMYVPQETTTPSSTHPRVSTRASCLCLRGLLRSYLYSLHESSQTRSTHKTRPDLPLTSCCTLRHPVALPRVLFPAAFNSHSVRRTRDFLQVAVLKIIYAAVMKIIYAAFCSGVSVTV